MTIEDHIAELRAELSWCDDATERRQIESELQDAQQRQKQHERSQRKGGSTTWR